jgi:hypothetical protein
VNRYIEGLNETAQQMTALADKLGGQRAQPLKPEEKQLIRLALLPQARVQLDEALYAFTVGKFITVAEGGQLYEFFRMAEDLKE